MLNPATWTRSLAGRLIIASSLWSAAALIAGALILTFLYRQTVENAFDARLNVYLQSLVGALATQEPQTLMSPGNLGEQQFENVFSGWYWQVTDGTTGEVVLASPSLFSDVLDTADAAPKRVEGAVEGLRSMALTGPLDQSLRLLARPITLGGEREVEVMIAGDAGELNAQTRDFGLSVALTLAVFGVGLIVATTAQILWGLQPLDRVRKSLARLRSGELARIEGTFPIEVAPLVRELNAVLESNQKVIERARTQVGNLAHALKTPLSVVVNECRNPGPGTKDKITEQTELMRHQINHHLDRARIAAQADIIGTLTDVPPAIDRMVRVMNRLNPDLRVTGLAPPGLKFRGDQQDLEEILGNLVDNACKFAETVVAVTVSFEPGEGDEDGRMTLRIEDDGPGLTDEQCREVTKRGRRLDETKPGSGLGLSIVTDLVGLYDGDFRLGRSSLGGLRADVVLPASP